MLYRILLALLSAMAGRGTALNMAIACPSVIAYIRSIDAYGKEIRVFSQLGAIHS